MPRDTDVITEKTKRRTPGFISGVRMLEDLGAVDQQTIDQEGNTIRAMKRVNPNKQPPKTDPYAVDTVETRLPYSSMKSHMEKAAVALATGASMKMAAGLAGVSHRQVKKYYQSRTFRARVDELRQVLMGQIAGRILTEFVRRTDDERIGSLEIMDLARIFDRATGAVAQRGAPQQTAGEAGDKYEQLIVQIANINPGSEGTHFPEYEAGDLRLPAGSSPVDE